ncbi:unnamed protein product [Peniophora sp. CBMAI 1063]|nr:unnamed protein product [Peniophora sp. CBMAI 1063]
MSPPVTNLPQALIEKPTATVTRLRSLFLSTRGSVLDLENDLVKAISSLSTALCVTELGLNEGRAYTGTLQVGQPLWKAIVSSEVLFLLLENIKDDSFVIQSSVWISDVLTCVAGFLSIWLARVLRTGNKLPVLPITVAQRIISEIDIASKPLWSRMAIFLNEKQGVPGTPYRILEMLCSICIDTEMLQVFFMNDDIKALSRNEFVPITFSAWARIMADGVDDNFKIRQTTTLLKDYWGNHVLGGGKLPKSDKAPKFDAAIALVGAPTVLRACCAQMASPMAVDMWLADILLLGGIFTTPILAQRTALREAFWASPICRTLLEALQRQVQTRGLSLGGGGGTFVRICKLAGDIIDWVGVGVDHGKCAAVHGRDCLEVLIRLSVFGVHGLRFIGQGASDIDSLLEKNATTLLSILAKWNFFIGDDSSMDGRGEDFRRVQVQMRTAARDAWYTTLLRLRALSDTLGKRTDYQNIVACWGALGENLCLKEDAEKMRHDQQGARLCSWATCQYYCTPAPNKLSTCKGCREARYCSRECQLSDWKQGGHRIVCRRVRS